MDNIYDQVLKLNWCFNQGWQSGQKIGGFGFYCGFFAWRIRIPDPNLNI